MEGTARSAARCYREVFFAFFDALFLVSAGYGVLEAGGVGRVARDGYIYAFVPHDGHAFAHVVGAVAFYFGAGTVGVGDFANDFQLAGVVVKLGLNIGEPVDARDDLGGVFSETVQDAAQGLFAHFVGFGGDFDGAFGGSERFVAGEEGEAFGLFAQQTGGEVTVAETYFAVVGYRAGNAEGLQADTDGFGSFGGVFAAFFQGDGATYDVGPLGVFEADGLGLFAGFVGVKTILVADGVCLFDVFDAVFVESSDDLFDTAFLALEFTSLIIVSCPPCYSFRGSMYFTAPASFEKRP